MKGRLIQEDQLVQELTGLTFDQSKGYTVELDASGKVSSIHSELEAMNTTYKFSLQNIALEDEAYSNVTSTTTSNGEEIVNNVTTYRTGGYDYTEVKK